MILLDTHIWIWLNMEPERIPASIASILTAEGEAVSLSVISIWEAMLAIEKGRVQIDVSPELTVRKWLEANPISAVPLNRATVILSRTLDFGHEDPADRFIAATAFSLGGILATADPQLIRLPWLDTVPI